MIHEVLTLTRPLIVFDTETTSTNTSEARIVELGFQLFTSGGLQKEYRTLVNPKIPIPPETTAIHGIKDEDVQVCRECGKLCQSLDQQHPHVFSPWPTFERLAKNIASGFSNCDFGGKNIRFDLKILSAEMGRAGVTWSYAGARIVDVDRLEQLGVPRTLSHLVKKHLGRDPEGAHHALDDVRMTTEVIAAQMRAYDVLPRDLDRLHDLQWPGWIDTEGKFKFSNGEARCTFGKYAGEPMRKIPRDYWDFILRADFSPEIKKLASDAKLGKFPMEVK